MNINNDKNAKIKKETPNTVSIEGIKGFFMINGLECALVNS